MRKQNPIRPHTASQIRHFSDRLLELDDTGDRFLGPNRLRDGVRSFGGAIRAALDRSTAPFVGREAMIRDGRLASLKHTQHWPQTISVFSPMPEPEKGEPHGAATLLRV